MIVSWVHRLRVFSQSKPWRGCLQITPLMFESYRNMTWSYNFYRTFYELRQAPPFWWKISFFWVIFSLLSRNTMVLLNAKAVSPPCHWTAETEVKLSIQWNFSFSTCEFINAMVVQITTVMGRSPNKAGTWKQMPFPLAVGWIIMVSRACWTAWMASFWNCFNEEWPKAARYPIHRISSFFSGTLISDILFQYSFVLHSLISALNWFWFEYRYIACITKVVVFVFISSSRPKWSRSCRSKRYWICLSFLALFCSFFFP